MWRQLSFKNSLLVICKIFELFLNKLTAGQKFSFLNRDKLTQPVHMRLSKKKIFQNISLHFWNVDKIFHTFRKKMTPIADVFRKLPIPKNVVRKMCKKSRFVGSFVKQHGKWIKQCWTLNDTPFTIYIDHCESN